MATPKRPSIRDFIQRQRQAASSSPQQDDIIVAAPDRDDAVNDDEPVLVAAKLNFDDDHAADVAPASVEPAPSAVDAATAPAPVNAATAIDSTPTLDDAVATPPPAVDAATTSIVPPVTATPPAAQPPAGNNFLPTANTAAMANANASDSVARDGATVTAAASTVGASSAARPTLARDSPDMRFGDHSLPSYLNTPPNLASDHATASTSDAMDSRTTTAVTGASVNTDKRCAELEAQLAKERKANGQLKITLLAYEKELQQLYEERNTLSGQRDDKLIEEMSGNMRELFDQVTSLAESNRQKSEEVQLLEDAFGTLKARYDEVKHLARAFKDNEAKLIAALTDSKKQLALAQAKFSALRIQAQQKLTHASEQIDRLKSVSEREIAILKAKLLKFEANILSASSTIRQKEIENQKISKICDSLISKLESASHVDDSTLRVTTEARRGLLQSATE